MFKGSLYDSQIPGAELLVNKKKALLCYEQGCGKSIISLAGTEKLFELSKAKTVLTVVPSSLTWQWADKIEEFTDSEYSLAEASNGASRTYEPIENGYNLVGYHLFRNDFRTILQHSFDIVIMDEAQEFRSTSSKTRKLVLELNREKDPTYRWALTGTAIANHLEELYSIFYWVDKNFLPPWPSFEKKHIVRNKRTKQIVSYKNLKSLNKILPHKMSRKEMSEMGRDFPELIEKIYTVKRSKEYEKAESKLLECLDNMVESLEINSKGNLKGIRRDRKVSRAFHETKQALWSKDKCKTALELSNTILSENPRNKILFFSFYKQPLYDLQKRLGSFGSKSEYFTGDQTLEQKRKAIKEVEEGSTRILLASNAGYKGLDLPTFNHVIHLDIPFSWEVLDQRNKRARRITSVNSTTVVIYLVFQYGIDLYYYNQVKRKGDLADATYRGTKDTVIVKPESLRQFLKKKDAKRTLR